MPAVINEAAQQKRRRDAIDSAVSATLWFAFAACVLLAIKFLGRLTGMWGTLLIVLALLDLGMIIPVWILLRKRLEEIEGGEEDAASEY